MVHWQIHQTSTLGQMAGAIWGQARARWRLQNNLVGRGPENSSWEQVQQTSRRDCKFLLGTSVGLGKHLSELLRLWSPELLCEKVFRSKLSENNVYNLGIELQMHLAMGQARWRGLWGACCVAQKGRLQGVEATLKGWWQWRKEQMENKVRHWAKDWLQHVRQLFWLWHHKHWCERGRGGRRRRSISCSISTLPPYRRLASPPLTILLIPTHCTPFSHHFLTAAPLKLTQGKSNLYNKIL